MFGGADLGGEPLVGFVIGRLAQRHADVRLDLPPAIAEAGGQTPALDLVLDHGTTMIQVPVAIVEKPNEIVDVACRAGDVQLVVHPDAWSPVVEQQQPERVRLGTLHGGAQERALHVERALKILTVSRRRLHRRRPRRRGG